MRKKFKNPHNYAKPVCQVICRIPYGYSSSYSMQIVAQGENMPAVNSDLYCIGIAMEIQKSPMWLNGGASAFHRKCLRSNLQHLQLKKRIR